MNNEYWIERWIQGEIGFHQTSVNAYLCQFWQQLQVPHGSTVAVPLCGKSRDMIWLREQQYAVLGIELSALAVHAFFEEHSLSPTRTTAGKFDRFTADGICILHGDFFDLRKEDFETVNAVYDRAALVALPSKTRTRYVQHLLHILSFPTQILLVTLDYPQHEMTGPPFAVSPQEVESLFYRHCTALRHMAHMDVLEQYPRFKERGLSRLHESIFLIEIY